MSCKVLQWNVYLWQMWIDFIFFFFFLLDRMEYKFGSGLHDKHRLHSLACANAAKGHSTNTFCTIAMCVRIWRQQPSHQGNEIFFYSFLLYSALCTKEHFAVAPTFQSWFVMAMSFCTFGFILVLFNERSFINFLGLLNW